MCLLCFLILLLPSAFSCWIRMKMTGICRCAIFLFFWFDLLSNMADIGWVYNFSIAWMAIIYNFSNAWMAFIHHTFWMECRQMFGDTIWQYKWHPLQSLYTSTGLTSSCTNGRPLERHQILFHLLSFQLSDKNHLESNPEFSYQEYTTDEDASVLITDYQNEAKSLLHPVYPDDVSVKSSENR